MDYIYILTPFHKKVFNNLNSLLEILEKHLLDTKMYNEILNMLFVGKFNK